LASALDDLRVIEFNTRPRNNQLKDQTATDILSTYTNLEDASVRDTVGLSLDRDYNKSMELEKEITHVLKKFGQKFESLELVHYATIKAVKQKGSINIISKVPRDLCIVLGALMGWSKGIAAYADEWLVCKNSHPYSIDEWVNPIPENAGCPECGEK